MTQIRPYPHSPTRSEVPARSHVAHRADSANIRRLIWLYFFLLVFEGALRKWIFPGYSNLLLVARDPIVLAIYFLALRSDTFPRNAFIIFGGALAVLSLFASFLSPTGHFFVTLYGFRANFLQLPMIFIIARFFDRRAILRVGFWMLVIAIPMAILMVIQFGSPPNAWINSGVDDSFKQIAFALGRVRAPGTFSYANGTSYFFPLVAAFIFYGLFSRCYAPGLMFASGVALIVANVVGGSRTMVLSVLIVMAFALMGSLLFKPKLAVRLIASLAVVAFFGLILFNFSFFREGLETFSTRLDNASRYEGGGEGFVARLVENFTHIYPMLFSTPFLGLGLGAGTNVGAVYSTGTAQMLLSEDDWGRHVLESGPVFGLALVMGRLWIGLWLGKRAFGRAMRSDMLPLLLFSTCAFGVISGSLGQPTSLGFIIFVAGLTFASIRHVPQTRRSPRNFARWAGSRKHGPNVAPLRPMPIAAPQIAQGSE